MELPIHLYLQLDGIIKNWREITMKKEIRTNAINDHTKDEETEDIGNRWRYLSEPGENGFGYQNFYHADTEIITELPRITYNGAFFTGDPGWDTKVPQMPKGAYVFIVPVRYQSGTPGATIEGIAVLGTVPEGTTPPKGPKEYTDGFEYGTANGNTPEGHSKND